MKKKLCDYQDCRRKALHSVKIVGRVYWQLCSKHKKEFKL
jgi:hypothetical protein